MKKGYIEQSKRKKILLICDDIRCNSGVGNIAKDIVLHSCHHYNYVNLGGMVNHPDAGKIFDLSVESDKIANITDSSIKVYCVSEYGNADTVRQMLNLENPDAVMIITDPRYFTWLFQIEHELRQRVPLIYYAVWDDIIYPYYNFPYYASCDLIMGISKQSHNIHKNVLGKKEYLGVETDNFIEIK